MTPLMIVTPAPASQCPTWGMMWEVGFGRAHVSRRR